MKQYLTRLQEWHAGLAQRERWMVTVCALAVTVAVLFLGVWEPLTQAHYGRESSLDASRNLAQRLEQIAADAQRARASGSVPVMTGGSLISVVDQASKSGTLGKQPRNLQPEGNNEVKVWIESVGFDALVRWLAELETRYGIQAQTVDIERLPTSGLVNARLSLTRP